MSQPIESTLHFNLTEQENVRTESDNILETSSNNLSESFNEYYDNKTFFGRTWLVGYE